MQVPHWKCVVHYEVQNTTEMLDYGKSQINNKIGQNSVFKP